jgi:hypothetical protein
LDSNTHHGYFNVPAITNIALNRGTSDVSGGDTLVVSNNDAGYIYDVRQASIDYFETKSISIQPISMTRNNTSISITDDGSKVAVGNSTSNNILVVSLDYSSVDDTQITASTNGFYIKKMVNTNDYQNIGQHNMQLRIENSMGIYDSKALEIGLLENGTGIIQANEKDVGYNTLLLNPLGGNVGIGVTNPSVKHEIHNTTEQIRGRFYSIGDAGRIDDTGLFVLNDLNYNASDNGQPTPNAFFCSNNNYSTNDNTNIYDKSDISYNIAGSIGFGTATPYFGSYAQYAQIRGLRLGQWDGGLSFATMGPTNGYLSEKMRIIDNGTVGIGTTTPNSSYKLDVNGDVNATSYNASSDYRIKENVVPISDTSYNIDNLRPVTYTNTKMEKQDFGVIAHELQEQIPFLVTGEKDGEHHQSVNYNGLIGLLLNEVQQLKKRVQELEQSKP